MFNLKLPIRLIMLLILTVIVNIFSTVTIEYNVISFQEYRNIEVDCGDLFSVLTINDINNVPDELKSDWRPCREKAKSSRPESWMSVTISQDWLGFNEAEGHANKTV